jgi:hypothetical protein
VSPVPAARGLFAVVVLTALLGLTGALGMPAAAADEPGQLRIAHLSPDTPAVDVAVAPLPPDGAPVTDPGPDLVTGLGYGGVGDFTGFPAGGYAVSLRAAGSQATAPPMLSTRVDLPPGGAGTVTVSGTFADLRLEFLPEDLAPPPPGSARVRVLAAAAEAGALDLSHDGGPVLASGLLFGGAGDRVAVPAGPALLRVADGRGTVDVPADLVPGSVATVLVLDRPEGGLTLRVVLDATSPAVVPIGGVEAGGGSLPAAWTGSAATVLALWIAAGRNRRRVVVLAAGIVVAGLLPAPLAAAGTVPPAPRPVVLAAEGTAEQPPPTRVRMPAVGVDAALEGVGLDAAGALVPPSDGATAGWFADGTAPGAPGPAVLTGHVDGGGRPAVFAALEALHPGDPVLVDRADGTSLRFVVTRVARYPKSAFPTVAVYGPTTGPELRLITCGGAFDRFAGSYLDNVVVWARAA